MTKDECNQERMQSVSVRVTLEAAPSMAGANSQYLVGGSCLPGLARPRDRAALSLGSRRVSKRTSQKCCECECPLLALSGHFVCDRSGMLATSSTRHGDPQIA
jgi:hypothetical protein